MRIPHYLHRARSGVWHYRQRMPRVLLPLLKKTEIKRALGTRELGPARELALKLWRAYDELHQQVRKLAMAGMTKDVKLLIERLKKSGTQYRLITKPDGTVEVEVTGPEDHALAMEAIARIGNLYKEPYVQRVLAEGNAPAPSPAPTPARATRGPSTPREAAPDKSRFPDKPIGKAIDEWEADIMSGTRPKTLVIKRMAVADFVKSFGTKRPVHDVTRVEIGKWVSELRARELATPTIVNRISYLKGFLD